MPTFTLASYNLRWGLDVDDRPFDLRAAIAALDADVIALQEVWEPGSGGDLAPVAAELGYVVCRVPLSPSSVEGGPQITPDPADAHGTWDLALLTRLPVLGRRTVDLGRLVERWDVANRYAILADLDVGGVTVTVATVHLSFVVPNAAAQLRRLRASLPLGRPSVVAGDCNLWGPLAVTALRGWRRGVRGRTWPAHRPHSQLDHVLVSPEVRVLDGAVGSPLGSDHLPVGATLAVEQRPTA